MVIAMRKVTALMVTLVAGMAAADLSVAATPDRVETLANACAVCHGPDGAGAQSIPKLNSELEVLDFVVTMKGYAAGTERAAVMDRIAKALTEDEIKQLARYFGNLE